VSIFFRHPMAQRFEADYPYGPSDPPREVYRRVDAPPQRHSGLKTGYEQIYRRDPEWAPPHGRKMAPPPYEGPLYDEEGYLVAVPKSNGGRRPGDAVYYTSQLDERWEPVKSSRPIAKKSIAPPLGALERPPMAPRPIKRQMAPQPSQLEMHGTAPSAYARVWEENSLPGAGGAAASQGYSGGPAYGPPAAHHRVEAPWWTEDCRPVDEFGNPISAYQAALQGIGNRRCCDPGFGVGCGAAQWAPNRRSKGRPAINRYPTPSIFYN